MTRKRIIKNEGVVYKYADIILWDGRFFRQVKLLDPYNYDELDEYVEMMYPSLRNRQYTLVLSNQRVFN